MNSTFLVLLLLFTVPSLSQWKGGNGDGTTVTTSTDQPLGRNIFRGGNDDGSTMSSASNQPMGRTIFHGGIDDGMATTSVANQPMGRNIFRGGNDDGISVAFAANQPMGRNIFRGGADDGFHVTNSPLQPLGRNIFKGGGGDGWALGIPGASNIPLPVSLISFTGEWQHDNALLKWQTASEINSAHFELERSFDGTHYSVISSLPAAGNSSSVLSYSYTDLRIKLTAPPATSNIFYRLRSVDLDGSSRYSGVILLKLTGSGLITYSIYPNPASDVIMVSGNDLSAGKKILTLSDARGIKVLEQPMTGNAQQINVGKFAAGIYFIRLIKDGHIEYTQKIIIQK